MNKAPLTGGTEADVRLLRNLATLVEWLPPGKRAYHLTKDCERLADRIEAGMPKPETRSFAEEVGR